MSLESSDETPPSRPVLDLIDFGEERMRKRQKPKTPTQLTPLSELPPDVRELVHGVRTGVKDLGSLRWAAYWEGDGHTVKRRPTTRRAR